MSTYYHYPCIITFRFVDSSDKLFPLHDSIASLHILSISLHECRTEFPSLLYHADLHNGHALIPLIDFESGVASGRDISIQAHRFLPDISPQPAELSLSLSSAFSFLIAQSWQMQIRIRQIRNILVLLFS